MFFAHTDFQDGMAGVGERRDCEFGSPGVTGADPLGCGGGVEVPR